MEDIMNSEAAAKKKGIASIEEKDSFLKGLLKSDKLGLMVALVLMIIVFHVLTEGKFFTGKNIINILIASAIVGLEFDAVTAAVLGGIAMNGGIGSLMGSLIGLFILQGFNNGLMMLNVQSFWQTVARGVLLIAALSFDFYRNKQRENAEKQTAAKL